MQFVGVSPVRTRLVNDARNGSGVECPEAIVIAAGPPRLHGVRPPLLQRRIVQECVRSRIDDFVAEGRRLWRVTRYEAQLTAVNPPEKRGEPLDVHRLFETITNRLRYERMLGNLTIARNVLEACRSVRKDRRHEIVGLHPLQLW